MKKIILISIVFCATTLFAQDRDSLLFQKQQQEITVLKSELRNQGLILRKQKKELIYISATTKKQIKKLEDKTDQNLENIKNIAANLGSKIQNTESSAKVGISKLDKDVEKNRLYWIIATLVILLLGSIVYWLLGKRIAKSKIDVETQIRTTKKSLEEESVKLDSKLVEILDTQLKLMQETTPANNETDHSLALKVADEIIRIQKNLHQMDANTKGLRQLSASVKRIQDNFASNGYELVEMLGKEYNEGMRVVPNFIINEDLETGKQIITRIIKPQVNFKGEMIQSAQIEVSVGE